MQNVPSFVDSWVYLSNRKKCVVKTQIVYSHFVHRVKRLYLRFEVPLAMTPSPHTKEKDTEAPSNDLAAGVTNCAPASSLANKAAPNPSLVTLLFAHHLQQQQQHQNAMLVSQLAASLSPGLLTQLCLVKQSFSQLQNGGFAATARPGEGLLSSGGGGTGFRMLNFPQFPIAGGGQRPQLSNMAALLKNTQQISQDDSRALEREPLRVRCGSFPERLHQMLLDLEAEEGGQGIASFLENGKAFSIRKQKAFAEQIMPKYFRMNKYSSFQRQLNVRGCFDTN